MTVKGDVVDGFFYDLLRDYLPAGDVERLVQDAEKVGPQEVEFSNPHLAAHSKEIRQRLDAVASKAPKAPCLDIDWLKSVSTKIHFFGLGFIQVKQDERTRFHFYSKDLPAFVENPHDHRYFFTSEVKKGTLRNWIWKSHHGAYGLLEGRAHMDVMKRAVSCAPTAAEREAANKGQGVLVNAYRVSQFDVDEGSSYFMDENTFHQVEVTKYPCVTRINRGMVLKAFANVLLLKEESCPFSQEIDEARLWEIVRSCL